MLVRTRLDEILDELDNTELMRVYDVARVYHLSSQKPHKPETQPWDTARLSNYLEAQDALAEVDGELSELLLAMREDRI